MIRRTWLALNVLLISSSSLFLGCSMGPKEIAIPNHFTLKSDAEDQWVLANYQDHSEQVKTFSALSHVEVSNKLASKKFFLSSAFEKPSRLRVEILPAKVARPLMVLTVDGKELTFVNRAERSYFQGNVSAESLGEALQVPLTEKEVIAWLSARIAVYRDERLENTAFYTAPGSAEGVLEVTSEDGRQYRYLVSADFEKLRVLAFEIWENKKLLVICRYGFEEEQDASEKDASKKGSTKSTTKKTAAQKSELPSSYELLYEREGLILKGRVSSSKLNPKWKRKQKKKLFRVKVPRAFKEKAPGFQGS